MKFKKKCSNLGKEGRCDSGLRNGDMLEYCGLCAGVSCAAESVNVPEVTVLLGNGESSSSMHLNYFL